MLLSMTGFGEAKTYQDGVTLLSEVRTVNNRFLKTSIRLPEPYAPLESRVEKLIHEYIERGTVSVSVKMIQDEPPVELEINTALLKSYIESVYRVYSELRASGDYTQLSGASVGDCLRLTGVVQERIVERSADFLDQSWALLSANLRQSFEGLQTMRRAEGDAMLRGLTANLAVLIGHIAQIESLAPTVVETYRNRLTETVARVMGERSLAFDEADLVREVLVYTDRTDISEETVRFRSHTRQFEAALADQERCGKKLDFLVQEMLREVNTIGSKANSSDITKSVVDMKAMLERVREMVQNIE